MPRGIPNTPRTPKVTNTIPSVAVSDVARGSNYTPTVRPNTTTTAPEPGQPHHATGWGAQGTTDSPPRSAVSSPTAEPPVIPPTQPEQPSPNAAPPTPPAPLPAQATPESSDRVAALEQQVSNLSTLLATVSNQLQNVTPPTPAVLPGTANPMAPRPHVGSTVQGTVFQKVEGPAIPLPSAKPIYDMNTPRLPNQARIPELQPGEETMSDADYIEKHFRLRDISIDQIAYMTRLEPQEVIDILKEMGYQFSDGM